jgi:hypothetical protein
MSSEGDSERRSGFESEAPSAEGAVEFRRRWLDEAS